MRGAGSSPVAVAETVREVCCDPGRCSPRPASVGAVTMKIGTSEKMHVLFFIQNY